MSLNALSARRTALAASVGLLAATMSALPLREAAADMVLTSDGKWWPADKSLPALGPDDEPTDEMLAQTENFKVDAGYDVVKGSGGFSKPAGAVVKIRASARALVPTFKQSLNDASSRFYTEAADGLAQAAGEAGGFGKQDALYMRVQAFYEGAVVDRIDGAIDDLLREFPKSFFLCEAMILRARVASLKGASQADLVAKALEAVKSAPGMNLRDQYRAERMRIYFLLENAKKPDEAKAAYETLIGVIEKGDREQGKDTWSHGWVGVGNALLSKGQISEASAAFRKAVESHDANVLAGAYSGLGDVALTEAKALREGKKLAEAKAKLEEAALHYLRVTEKYRGEADDAVDAVLRSMTNAARVFGALFDLSGGKDLESARRAIKKYGELGQMMPDGPQKKGLVREANALNDRYKEAAAKEGGAAPAGGGAK